MAKYTFTAIYSFKYRFQCEHCDQTTEWKNTCFRGQTEYQASVFEGKELRLAAEKQFIDEFLKKKVPALREQVKTGEYNVVYGNLDGCCPNCKKRQSWEKEEDLGWIFGGGAFLGVLALIAWGMFNSGADTGNGKKQLAGLLLGLFGAGGFLFSMFLGILGARRKAAIMSDTENVTVRRKPEFSWPHIEQSI